MAQLEAGTYRLMPSRSGYLFVPRARRLRVPPDQAGVTFIGFKLFARRPALIVSHPAGRPGSQFALSCANFPPNATLTVQANAHLIGRISADQDGLCGLALLTDGADAGRYTITVTARQAATGETAEEPIASASAGFTIAPTAPLLTEDGEDVSIHLPAGTARSAVYLPMLPR